MRSLGTGSSIITQYQLRDIFTVFSLKPKQPLIDIDRTMKVQQLLFIPKPIHEVSAVDMGRFIAIVGMDG